MILNGLSNISLEESRFYYDDMLILEKGEGPRWKFGYDNFKVDPSPDILLLGAYRHPSTGNNLIGGINLHYLSKGDLDRLANALPKIMDATNLYYRYHAGKRLVPDIFKRYYRTYNASYVRGVEQDVMYPKYGLLKTAKDWLRKKVTGIFKNKEQRKKDAEPQYPTDLSNMRNRLNQVVSQLQSQPSSEVQQDTPEMQAARKEYQKLQAQQTKQIDDIERDENKPLVRSAQAHDQNINQPQAIQHPERPITPIARQQEVKPAVKVPEEPEKQDVELPIDDTADIDPEPGYDRDAIEDLEQEKQQSQEELQDPENEIDLEESLIYYSPLEKRYIIEPAFKLFHQF